MNISFGSCFLGRTIVLDSGKIEVTVTLDVGPRIIGLKPKNGFNVMFEDVKDVINKDCSSYYGEGKKWHIYGGHRLWLSPEDITTYYPDNDKVEYFIKENSVSFKTRPWAKVEVQPELEIEFLDKNEVSVTHKITNLGEQRRFCIWALTVMKSGGEMTFDLSKENTGLLANRNIVLWPYSSLKDERLALEDDKILLKSSNKVSEAFKIGAYNSNIKAKYTLSEGGKTQVFVKENTAAEGLDFPDYFCNFESYCNSYIHEVETLSGFHILPKNGEFSYNEKWSVFSILSK